MFELNSTLEKKVIDRTLEVNKLLREKTRFIDNLSHDIGTPLTPIFALLPLIKDSLKDPSLVEMVDTCMRNTEYIKHVVQNTRELAEIATTDFILKNENLFDTVNMLLKKYEPVFKSFNIVAENRIENNIFIKTEKVQFLRLLDHITSNAVNSMTSTGGGKLIFSSKPAIEGSKDYIQISITDTGEGMNKEELKHIFDEFYKTDDSRHKLESTGLGLTICKNIVQKHNGNIWAESEGKGMGATISFTIPSTGINPLQSCL